MRKHGAFKVKTDAESIRHCQVAEDAKGEWFSHVTKLAIVTVVPHLPFFFLFLICRYARIYPCSQRARSLGASLPGTRQRFGEQRYTQLFPGWLQPQVPNPSAEHDRAGVQPLEGLVPACALPPQAAYRNNWGRETLKFHTRQHL